MSVDFNILSDTERDVIGQALRAAADGPFFPDWEFRTLFGLHRDQLRRISSEWPMPTAPSEDVLLAVNNAFNMLLSYPHRKDEFWSHWITVDRKTFNDLFTRLRGTTDEKPFDRLM